ncbi:MAG: FAD:protein FMN transferase [Chitinispirillaceae bacterium]|nr:FAD:protein FMN transferase [Chitinispirillaceae bacterium]
MMRAVIVLCAAGLLAAITGCFPRPVLVKRLFFRMDTVTEVMVVLEKRERSAEQALWTRIDSLLETWEKRFSQLSELSEVRAINNRTTVSMPLSPDLAVMVDYALRFGDTLDGGFDLTIFPVKELWGFGERDTALYVPSQRELDSALRRVSWKKVGLSAGRDSIVIHDPVVTIDVGGVAKGAALHAIARLLETAAYRDFLIVSGGDIIAQGKKPDGKSWHIGVQHPRKKGTLLAAIVLDSGCIVTSGDYERFYFDGTTRYHHLFNSRTGRPGTNNQSLTVWAMDPFEADVLSTGLFCLPAASIVEFINKRPRFHCIVVDSSGGAIASDGLKKRIEWK